MKKVALVSALVLAIAATPAVAQRAPGGGGGASPTPTGPPDSGLTADRPPQEVDPAYAQQEINARNGDYGKGRISKKEQKKEIAANLKKLDEFKAEMAPRREEAFAWREAALSGNPVDATADGVKAKLEEDLASWRDTFAIPPEAFTGLHSQLVPADKELSAAQWANRRAQWFEAQDGWIAEQRQAMEEMAGG